MLLRNHALKYCAYGLGKVAWYVRELMVLQEDQGSIPSTHMVVWIHPAKQASE